MSKLISQKDSYKKITEYYHKSYLLTLRILMKWILKFFIILMIKSIWFPSISKGGKLIKVIYKDSTMVYLGENFWIRGFLRNSYNITRFGFWQNKKFFKHYIKESNIN